MAYTSKIIDWALDILASDWKIFQYARDGKLKYQEFDKPLIIDEGNFFYRLPDTIFRDKQHFLDTLDNKVRVSFGVVAITLESELQDNGYPKPSGKIQTDMDAFRYLVYHLRNAYAHNMANPKWCMRSLDKRCKYSFCGEVFDLTNLNGIGFSYDHVGGFVGLHRLADITLYLLKNGVLPKK